MIDVNQITTTLRGMADRALQQYAMMNKTNPYILSLAVAESNQRKQLRTAAQARNMAPQPKVADAAIAGIAEAPPAVDAMGNVIGMASGGLPEDQGIGRLPAPNMQRMADGGIAGYGDDEESMAQGGMFDFAQRSEPVIRMSGGGHIPSYQGNIRDGSVVSSNPMYAIPGMAAVQPRAEFTQQGAPENTPFFQRIMESLSGSNKERQLAMIEQKIVQGTATPEEVAAYKEVKIKGGDKAATDAKYPPQDAIRTKDFAGVKPGFEKPPADMYGAASPPPPPGAKPTAGNVRDLLPAPPKLDTSFKPAPAPTADEAMAQGDKFFNSKARIAEINRQVLQEQTDTDRARENSIEALKAFNEKQGPAYAGYEKLLQKEELQDATDKEKAGLTALFKGFLAIAAGESPNAATNIAKGSMVGLEEYSGAMKEFKKSAKERNKEMQNIQQARRAEERGEFDKVQMYEEKASTARQASARFGLAAINDITNTSGKVNADIFQNMRTITSSENIAGAREAGLNTRFMAEQSGLNARAAMSENRADLRSQTPERILFDQLRTKHGGDALKATEEMQKLKAEKFNLYDSYSKYLTAFANKEGVSPPITFDQYAKQFIPEVNPNKNTTIRTQPGG